MDPKEIASVVSHLFYSEYGADIEGSAVKYDPVTKRLAIVAVRLHFPLNNHAEVLLFVHHAGDPPPTHPDQIIPCVYKGEDIACDKEELGLRVVVNGHINYADPNPHPPGTRLTTIETFLIPNVFA